MNDFDLNGIEKIITYHTEGGEKRCSFIYNYLDDTGVVKMVDLTQEEAAPLLARYLNEVKHYKTSAFFDGTLENDPTFSLNKNYYEWAEEQLTVRRQIQQELQEGQRHGRRRGSISGIRNFHGYKRLMAIGLGTVLAGTSVAGLIACSNKKNQQATNSVIIVDTEATPMTEKVTEKETEPAVIIEDESTLWDRIVAKASQAQKQFLSAAVKTIHLFNQQFASQHQEENVIFPDAHVEPVVQFGISPEEFASAYILGADFTKEQYAAFMNDSNISILEYSRHWQEWLKQMHHASIVAGSQEDLGLLNYVTTEEGKAYIEKVVNLRASLKDAKERGDVKDQRKYVNELYQIFMESYKMEEAATLEPTYENFKSLELPDYILVAKPIFDAVHEEYRNALMDDGKHFYDELYEKNFNHGIYCQIYEWTMQENIAYQEARLSQTSYQANENYADYDELIRAARTYLAGYGLLKESDNPYRYNVAYLSEVQEVLSNTVTWSLEEENVQEDDGIVYIGGGNSGSGTHTEVTVETEVTKEKVEKKDMTKNEKQQASEGEKEIQKELDKENEKNKQEALEKAEELAQKDQAVEDKKKEEIDQQVQSENQQTQQQIEQGNIPSDATQEQVVDGNSVKDPTTDGTGAVTSDTPLPDPEDYYNNQNAESSTLPPATSDQSGTIIEGEIPIEYSYEEADTTSYEEANVYDAPQEEISTDAPVEVASIEVAPTNYTIDSYEMSEAEQQALAAMMNGQSVDDVVNQMAQESAMEDTTVLQK